MTKMDILNLVNNTYKTNLALHELEIQDYVPADSVYVTGIKAVCAEFSGNGTLCVAYDKKIAAIKKLRELVPGLGLADAKAAVENVAAAIQYNLATGQVYQYRY